MQLSFIFFSHSYKVEITRQSIICCCFFLDTFFQLYLRCIGHIAGQAEVTWDQDPLFPLRHFPTPHSTEFFEAMRVEWRKSTPRFAKKYLISPSGNQTHRNRVYSRTLSQLRYIPCGSIHQKRRRGKRVPPRRNRFHNQFNAIQILHNYCVSIISFSQQQFFKFVMQSSQLSVKNKVTYNFIFAAQPKATYA